jgi:hypothetical protein
MSRLFNPKHSDIIVMDRIKFINVISPTHDTPISCEVKYYHSNSTEIFVGEDEVKRVRKQYSLQRNFEMQQNPDRKF